MAALSSTGGFGPVTLRFRFSAMDWAKLAVSSRFSFHHVVGLSTSPLEPSSTGCAAPMRVCGAITATSAAMVMNTPALPARAGAGDT